MLANFNSLERRSDAGALAENFVFLSLRNAFLDWEIDFLRTIAEAEVDFILKIGRYGSSGSETPAYRKAQDFKRFE